jgi:hypothetical protein
MISASATRVRVPVTACKIPPVAIGSVGVAIDISLVNSPKWMPGRPLLITVRRILIIGKTVRTAPNETNVLTNASLAAGAPLLIKAKVEVSSPYAIKKIKAYANFPFSSVAATKTNEKAAATRKIESSRALSAGRFAHGFCGFISVLIALISQFS